MYKYINSNLKYYYFINIKFINFLVKLKSEKGFNKK